MQKRTKEKCTKYQKFDINCKRLGKLIFFRHFDYLIILSFNSIYQIRVEYFLENYIHAKFQQNRRFWLRDVPSLDSTCFRELPNLIRHG